MHQESLVLKASGAFPVQLVNKASLGHMALMDLLDQWAHLVYLVLKVILELKEKRVILV